MLDFKKHLNILDFDIETRPLTYWAPNRPSAEITAIGAGWKHDYNTIDAVLLGVHDPVYMLQWFLDLYNEADMVLGHFIRRFDLPMINGALMEYGLPGLTAKMTIDTRMDMRKKGDIPASQEYLGELFNLPNQKVIMSQHKWRKGNRLQKDGIEGARKRVVGDVIENMDLHTYMVEHKLLGSPKLWKP